MAYVTAATIRQLREKKRLTQKELADILCVSDKTISKWETGKGLPDAAILEDLAAALGVSITQLFTGDLSTNQNQAGNLKKMEFYVCPVCGNVITALGKGSFCCCGISLPALEPEVLEPEEQPAHDLKVEIIDGDYYLSMEHSMTKTHSISFMAYVTGGTAELIKLYPEQEAAVRFRKKGHGILYAYCTRHGLFRKLV